MIILLRLRKEMGIKEKRLPLVSHWPALQQRHEIKKKSLSNRQPVRTASDCRS